MSPLDSIPHISSEADGLDIFDAVRTTMRNSVPPSIPVEVAAQMREGVDALIAGWKSQYSKSVAAGADPDAAFRTLMRTLAKKAMEIDPELRSRFS